VIWIPLSQIDGIDAVWRIAGLTILISIIIHGTLADHVMEFGETKPADNILD